MHITHLTNKKTSIVCQNSTFPAARGTRSDSKRIHPRQFESLLRRQVLYRRLLGALVEGPHPAQKADLDLVAAAATAAASAASGSGVGLRSTHRLGSFAGDTRFLSFGWCRAGNRGEWQRMLHNQNDRSCYSHSLLKVWVYLHSRLIFRLRQKPSKHECSQ